MKILYLIIIQVLVMSINIFGQDALPEEKISYRPAMFSGSFYPSNPDTLREMINQFLELNKPTKYKDVDIIGMAVPHAGYVFSGLVAGRAYKELIGRQYDAIILIAPSHRESFSGASVFRGDAYVTPLGNVNIDKTLSKLLTEYDNDIILSMKGHRWDGNYAEHSLEVQIPFLQIVQPSTSIVAVVMGSQDLQTQDKLVRSITKAVNQSGKKCLIIASTDLSHFHDAETAESIDKPLVRTFARYDYFAMQHLFSDNTFQACGAGPLTTMMMASEQLGANQALPIIYLHSGDTEAGSNRKDRVVGYFSGITFKGQSTAFPDFTDTDKERLIEQAKKGVTDAIHSIDENQLKTIVPLRLSNPYPTFVTLKKENQLRACMGHTFARVPLMMEVYNSAKLAALNDYRFGPIENAELDELEYEITVLSRFIRVLNLDEIQIGRDGLYIRLGKSHGLLLPQVASERNWDTITFLEHLSEKAGLHKSSYMHSNAELFRFEAVIIHESEKE